MDKKQKNIFKATVALVVALAFIMPGATTIAYDENEQNTTTTGRGSATVSVLPAVTTVETNEIFTVGIYVEPSELTIGINIDDIFFNNTLLTAMSVSKGGFWGPNEDPVLYPGEYFFSPGTINNGAGTIEDVYGLMLNTSAYTSDPGYFVNVQFKSKTTLGSSEIGLSGVIVSNETGIPMTLTINNGTVNIEQFVNLTITIAGSGGGTTTPAAGVTSHPYGTNVTLIATPNACSTFAGWSGDTTVGWIVMDGDKAVTATFDLDYYDLTMAVSGSGTTSPAVGVHNYACGTVVPIQAFPDYCQEFTSWSGDHSGTTNPDSVTIMGDMTVTANFAQIYYNLWIIETEGGNETNYGEGNHTIACGATVTLNGDPDDGYSFAGWSGDIVTLDNPTSFMMDGDKTITANFARGWEICIDVITINADDYVCLGESIEAFDDEGPVDPLDIPKPGHPPTPFVYAWLQTSMAAPYDVLWEEFRLFDPANNTCKEWILWVHTDDANDSIPVTLDWGSPVTGTGYDTVELIDGISGEVVADMTSVSSYTYTAYHCCPQMFIIRLCMTPCPVAIDDEYEVYQEFCLDIEAPGVLENDINALGLTVTWDTSGIPLEALGTITTYANGSFEYCPPHMYNGSFEFNYTIDAPPHCVDDLTATVNITVIPLFEIDLQPGWNLISVPVGGECDDPCVVCKDVILATNCTGIMGNGTMSWDDAVLEGWFLDYTYGWECDDILGGCQMYTANVDCLISGEGYWLYAYEAVTLLVPTDQCEDYHGTHITYLCEGWNLVGIPYPTDMVLNEDIHVVYQGDPPALWLTAAANGWVLEFVYGWNNSGQNYMIINSPDFGDGILYSGRAYWMYSFVGAALKKHPDFDP